MEKYFIPIVVIIIAAVIAMCVARGIKTYGNLKKNKITNSSKGRENISVPSGESVKNLPVYNALRRKFNGRYAIIPNVKLSELMVTDNLELGTQNIDFVVYAIGKMPILAVCVLNSERDEKRANDIENASKLLNVSNIKFHSSDEDREIDIKLNAINIQ